MTSRALNHHFLHFSAVRRSRWERAIPGTIAGALISDNSELDRKFAIIQFAILNGSGSSHLIIARQPVSSPRQTITIPFDTAGSASPNHRVVFSPRHDRLASAGWIGGYGKAMVSQSRLSRVVGVVTRTGHSNKHLDSIVMQIAQPRISTRSWSPRRFLDQCLTYPSRIWNGILHPNSP